uniref:Odorant receptor n=1 Tax=Cacopsylla melanoneura TaxID=428564 RepID=A0A8D9DYM4_9HEMI
MNIFSLTHVFKICELCGIVNFYQFKSESRNRLQSLYVAFIDYLTAFYVACQSFNVYTRAIRYHPEFVQTFCEHVTSCFCLFVVFYLQKVPRRIYSVCKFMDTFSQADRLVFQKCNRQAKHTLFTYVTLAFTAILGSFFESLAPITNNELAIRRNVYRTKYPERRLIFNTRIPFIDESESWAHEIIYVIQLYFLTYFIACASTTTSLIPVLAIHTRGQYEILCKYICLIGQDHRDHFGCRIFYSNIEKNEYIIEGELPKIPGPKPSQWRLWKAKLRRQKIYEANYLRQVIRFHHKLLAFQDEVCVLCIRIFK